MKAQGQQEIWRNIAEGLSSSALKIYYKSNKYLVT